MNKSLSEGTVPHIWKLAHITPMYKKGSKSDCGNYRPVSLTSVVCKVLETIIREHLLCYLTENSLLSNCQHGFINGRSCATQLMHCLDIWTKAIDEGLCLDAIYLDFAKAFDSVAHERLLIKLREYGIKDNILDWCRSFLTGRKQRVVLNGAESNWYDVLSGVPQGSVLGPIFFVLFVNDMPSIVHNFVALFADDAKVFTTITENIDCVSLQEDLKNLQCWAATWQLNFNAKKCKVMHVGHKNEKFTYHMGDICLESVNEEKDLGVVIDDKLKFDAHTEKQVNKANRQLAIIRRSFVNLDKDTFCLLYKSLVRTHLEYCNAITYPKFERQVKLLEGVQRRATKLVQNIKHLPYLDRLKALNLPSLVYRRARGDVIEAYKYLHGLYNVCESPLVLDDRLVQTRGHSLKLKKISCKTSLRQKFFVIRVVDLWNRLPEEIVMAPSINALKNRLDKHWINHKFTLQLPRPPLFP